MGSKYRNSFFDEKRDWSKYKDSILNYYLVPYLQKVKELRKPICIVDMFAGRGEFKTGEPGSPKIIATRVQEFVGENVESKVKLRAYENYKPFYAHLAAVLKPYQFAEVLQKDCFSDLADIAQLGSGHTLLLYIDPCDVGQLSLSKLSPIFDKVKQRSSVEVLMIFMARAFMRQAALALKVETQHRDQNSSNFPLLLDVDDDDKAMWGETPNDDTSAVRRAQSQRHRALLSDIAGGDYWDKIVQDAAISWEERGAKLVDRYRQRLKTWFSVAEALPVRPDDSQTPKYWILFLSRYEPAFDLFNRAACNVVRSQRHKASNNTLFPMQAGEASGASPPVVDRAVKRSAKLHSKCRWNKLRWETCGGRNVGEYTDSEVDQSIKRLLKDDWLTGAPGNKVEDDATLSPTEKLKSWIDRS